MADTTQIKSGLEDDKVALWERHEDHPDGEIFVAGDTVVEAALTPQVRKHLASGRLVEVKKAAAKAAPADKK